ncbi:MAG: DMT family transporter [Gracilibacteraceae bacterium]|jgi:drug/metabolite transporter (DMT)-like permease|nr:DMT family transporter [Gracilibacteraceae bacterium]
MNAKRSAVICAVLAAVCYGLGAPAAKLLLADVSPYIMASALHLGAGFGMLAVRAVRSKASKRREARLTRCELPYTAAMIALDIAAPVLLMLGLSLSSSATVSLLNNFEIVVTTLIALFFFKEAVGRRVWIAIALITAASAMLSVEDSESIALSVGAVFVLLACLCWGLENNCTRKLSLRDPLQIVVVKGIGSGFGALALAAFIGESVPSSLYVSLALLVGFVSYGLSIYFYILAQRTLGAARTSAYYAVAPFIGVALSFAIFRETPSATFLAALVIMLAGTYFLAFEKHAHSHAHTSVEHEHRHSHDDGHHTHTHEPTAPNEHSHAHSHESIRHSHAHTPDLHHAHTHQR